MRKLKLLSELGQPILDWISSQKDLEKYLDEKPPQHEGYVVGVRNLNIESDKLVKGKFPYATLKNINKHILKEYGLSTRTKHDNHDGIFLSYSTKGHSVYIHQDKNPDDKHTHVRFNYMLSKPKGGDPIIDNDIIEIKQDEVWVCIAGNTKHGTTPIKDNKPRIMISFGHFIKNEKLKELK